MSPAPPLSGPRAGAGLRRQVARLERRLDWAVAERERVDRRIALLVDELADLGATAEPVP